MALIPASPTLSFSNGTGAQTEQAIRWAEGDHRGRERNDADPTPNADEPAQCCADKREPGRDPDAPVDRPDIFVHDLSPMDPCPYGTTYLQILYFSI
jgi:hypothetical protein